VIGNRRNNDNDEVWIRPLTRGAPRPSRRNLTYAAPRHGHQLMLGYQFLLFARHAKASIDAHLYFA